MLFNYIYNIYRKMVYTRADDNGTVFYFSSEDFPGLNCKPFEFKSIDGHNLKGYFYHYDNFVQNRIIFFDHGLGSGHRGYMREIETLARHGYLVFSYDHTGCMESGGKDTGGFIQSLKDLNDAINAVTSLNEYSQCDVSVVGHSWGGFSTLNICALQPKVSHIVSLSGFTSVNNIISQFFPFPLSVFGKKIYAKECDANPQFINYDAIESLKKSNVKALIIHSVDDKTVNFKKNFMAMKNQLSSKDNIEFLSVTGKNHNPNYTDTGVKLLNEFFTERSKLLKKNQLTTEVEKKNFLNRYDWNKMTEQDPLIWDKIFKNLDK